MTTWNRICIKEYTIKAENGDELQLKRGREYLTSPATGSGNVWVFSTFWVQAPVDIFAGEQKFT